MHPLAWPCRVLVIDATIWLSSLDLTEAADVAVVVVRAVRCNHTPLPARAHFCLRETSMMPLTKSPAAARSTRR
jgi:hypothetical protein